MKWVKWFYPGLKVKRWLFLAFLGTLLVSAGLSITNQVAFLGWIEGRIRELTFSLIGQRSSWLGGLLIVVVGLLMVMFGMKRMLQSLLGVLVPGTESELVDLIYQRRSLKKGPKIVVIGGGTGLSVLLRGLKNYTSNLTAIVTVSDDGGSSGRLRGELGVLPPGDIRSCLVALADTETLMDEVLSYRFRQGKGLAGHNLGNLLLVGMSEITGDFVKAIQEVSKVLAVRGRVLPSTLNQVVLCAELGDGTIIEGETRITRAQPPGSGGIKRVFLKPADCQPVPQAITAIEEADAIILGPGSLYTSVLPNLLVQGIQEAVRRSRAGKFYVCNVMTQPGETEGYSAADHLRAIQKHCGPGIVDYIIVNDQEVNRSLLRKYREKGAYPVRVDPKHLRELKVKVVSEHLLDETDLVRHDPVRLAQTIIKQVIKFKLGVDRHYFDDLYLVDEPGKFHK